MLQETGMHPAELKDRVTSPGGTTIAGVAQLEQAGFRSLIAAVQAAKKRSQELEVSTRQRGVAEISTVPCVCFHKTCVLGGSVDKSLVNQ